MKLVSSFVLFFVITTASAIAQVGPTPVPTNLPYPNVQGPVVNVLNFGADNTGATDTTAALNAATTAAGNGSTVYVPCGTYEIGTTGWLITETRLSLKGDRACVRLRPLNTLSAPMVTITGSHDTVQDFFCEPASATTASNPAYPCFEVLGVVDVQFLNMWSFYANGPLVSLVANGVGHPASGFVLSNIQCNYSNGCVLGDQSSADTSGGTQSGGTFGLQMVNITSNNALGATAPLSFKDGHDIYITNVFFSTGNGSLNSTAPAIQLTGDVTPVKIEGLDGNAGTASAILETDSDATGSPAGIEINDGIWEYGPRSMSINGLGGYGGAAPVTGLKVQGVDFIGATGTSCNNASVDENIYVASAVTGAVSFVNNNFYGNGCSVSGSTFYEFNIASTHPVIIAHNTFVDTPANVTAILNSAASNEVSFVNNIIVSTTTAVSGTKPLYFNANLFPTGTAPNQSGFQYGSGAPSGTCILGSMYVRTDTSAGSGTSAYACRNVAGTPTWEAGTGF